MSQSSLKHRDVLDDLDASSAVLFPVPPKSIPSAETISITDLRCIGSYNWQESEQPTMIVPGSPRIWNESSSLPTVAASTKDHVLDENRLHLPATPLLPIFLAVSPTFDWPSVDIITDRNNLQKLFSWVQGRAMKFRIDVERAGDSDTVLLTRWEEQVTVSAPEGANYGEGFQRAATTTAPGCESAAMGYHRIVSYNLGGVCLVVRSRVEACLPGAPEDGASESFPPSDYAEPILNVVHAGCNPPESSLIELVTKKKKGNGGWRQRYEKMFFGQTAAIYIAYHDDGKFKSVTKKTKAQLAYHEEKMQPELQQLRQALVRIQSLAKEHAGGAFSLVKEDDKDMKVYKRERGWEPCLPQRYMDVFRQN
ncbi:hypothetical protein CYLTODRAFT_424363 [Cylindrobasidium torrendii FP15055 ss-10]|uniref:Uncharacterized protein n=1 Tax=Cylindrobasidium torrendii FP15055 ss-10 TaxID=1314674 RepID=A0A0D7B5B2_9AGAR|nr:hypothetical protein CYLTODRAFT_424363 [Cylindrobasidium torrendii FP15055 ss-10]